MESFIRDIRFGLKLLLKDRSFALTGILTLAVCIGGNAAIFAIVNSVLLKPLPVPESERIVLMSNQYPKAGIATRSTYSGSPDYYDRLKAVTALEEQAMFSDTGMTIDMNGSPELVPGMNATPSLFRLLRMPAALGRAFNDDEATIGNERKVVLSYGLWQQLFAGDPAAVGRELRLSGRPYTIVGVMPRDFLFMNPEVRFWVPIAFTDRQKSDDARHSNNWHDIGRLKPGARIEQVQAQVEALNAANLERFPNWKPLLLNAGFYTSVEPLQEMLVRDIRGTLYLLWGGAMFVLLIGGVNIANVTLARSRVRLKELATRLALGAARARITRQIITESVIVTLFGGVAGLLLGWWTVRGLVWIGLERIPRANEVRIDASVIAFTLGIALVSGILVGLISIRPLFGLNLTNVLREEGRSNTGGRTTRVLRRALVVVQIAFAFVLLIGAGLLLASFRQLLAVDPGFKAAGVITASTGAPRVKYPENKDLRVWMDAMLKAIREAPGVTDAGATTSIPLGGNHSDSVILAEGYVMQPGESLVSPTQVTATTGYFEAMGIRLLRGRYFDEHDVPDGPGAVIVDQTLAHKFWKDADPVGKRMYQPSNPKDLLAVDEHTRWLTVVGVVSDVRQEDIAGDHNSAGTYYFAFAQNPFRNGTFAVKTATDTGSVLKTVRTAIAKIDPELPLYDVRTMAARTELSLMSRKTAMILALAFGGVALFLSAVGIYGVLAYLVAQRTKEIGIRIALGSTTADIFRLVLSEGAWLVVAGLIIGVGGTVALRRAIETQIYGVKPLDPFVIGIAILALGFIALLACILPSRRATKVDPVIVLNS